MSATGSDKSPSKQWMKSFKAYSRYKQENNRRPTRRQEDNRAVRLLAMWEKNQRQQYRRLCMGEKSSMTMQKIALLKSIDFAFVVQGPPLSTRTSTAKTVSKTAPLQSKALPPSPAKVPLMRMGTTSTVSKIAPLPPAHRRPGACAKEVWAGPPDEFLEGGWPPGWVKRVFERVSGKSKGDRYRYLYPPNNGKKLRSMVEVRRYLGVEELPKAKGERPRKAVSFIASNGEARIVKPLKKAKKGTAKQKVTTKRPVTKRARRKPVAKKKGPRFTEEDLRLVRAYPC